MAAERTRGLVAVAAAAALLAVGIGWAALARGGHADESPDEVADAKLAVVSLLSERLETMALPGDLEERRRDIRTHRDERRQRLAAVWAPGVLTQRVAELEQALRSVGADASYETYVSARFVVDDWVDVEVDRDEARATLAGHDEFVMHDGSTRTSDHSRYELSLVDAGPSGEWLLSESREEVVGSAG